MKPLAAAVGIVMTAGICFGPVIETAWSQSVQLGWSASFPYGEPVLDRGPELALDAAGNSYVGGHAPSERGDSDFTVLKYDRKGEWVWGVQEDGHEGGSDHLTAMHVDKHGYVYLAGNDLGAETHVTVIKLDPRGRRVWSDRRPGHTESLSVNSAGEVVIGGFRRTGANGFDQPLVIKWDAHGGFLWESVQPSDTRGDLQSVVIDDLGEVYAAGRDFRTVKFGVHGNELWRSTLEPGVFASHIALDPRGKVVVSGGGQGRLVTAALSPESGLVEWRATLDTGVGTSAAAILFDSEGHCLVSAAALFGEEQLLVKHDPDGRIQWVYRMLAGQEAGAFAIALDRHDHLYLAAATAGDGLASDVITQKLDPMGGLIWSVTYEGPGQAIDLCGDIGLDSRGTVRVALASYGGSPSAVWTTLQYVPRHGP